MLSDRSMRIWMLAGLVLMPFQNLKLSIFQPVHLWAMAFVLILLQHKELEFVWQEVFVYLVFMGLALINTLMGGYEHVKAIEQILKFGLVYPAIYLIGRSYGLRYEGKLPVGMIYLYVFVAVEYLIQFFEIPVLYRQLNFAPGALRGSFLERGWLASYILLLSYMIFLRTDRSIKMAGHFMLINLIVMFLSESKSALIQCGIILLIWMRTRLSWKMIFLIIGAIAYWAYFSEDLTGGRLRIRLEDERGLAYKYTIDLIADNWLGYGFGFVESYFSKTWFYVQGLGLGANSIFSSPLDFALIAGPCGVLLWCVFFAGIGVRSIRLLAPIAAGSLINPYHQSEIIYLFCGLLVSQGLRHAKSRQAFELSGVSGSGPAIVGT